MPNAHVPAQQKLHDLPRQRSLSDSHPSGPAYVLSPLGLACAARTGRRLGMPLRANLLRIRSHRHRNAWTGPRDWTCDLAPAALPPILPRRARPSPHPKKQRPLFGDPDSAIPESKRNGRCVRECSAYAAQAINIERAVPRTFESEERFWTLERCATPQRQEEPFARNSQS
jgi:hypothetical protein